MTEHLDDRSKLLRWSRVLLALAPGDLLQAVDEVGFGADRGDVRQLVADVLDDLEAAPPGERTFVEDALESILTDVSSRLRTPALRDQLLVAAAEDSGDWRRAFSESDAAIAASAAAGAGTQVDSFVRRAALLLADRAGVWVRDHYPHRRQLQSAVDGEILRLLRSSQGGDAASSENAQRLIRRSRRYLGSVERSFRADGSGKASYGHPLYVRRELEAVVCAELEERPHAVLLLSGPAGYGKTSLLWGLADTLSRVADLRTVAVSATWLRPMAGSGTAFGYDQLNAALTHLDSVSDDRFVVLLDTADLLLHDDAEIESLHDLISTCQGLGIGLVIAVRPVEADAIDVFDSRHELSDYSDDEMHRACRALMTEFFRSVSAEESRALLDGARKANPAVDEVTTSPLMLRMLFELADGALPDMDIDVMGLYERYWENRVMVDTRAGSVDGGTDLSGTVERLGIAMLAEGLPEMERSAAVAVTERVEHPVPADRVAHSMDVLIRRGVLVHSSGRVRFSHQTLFEFAAACGLVRRGGAAEVSRLVDHVIEHPLDLFAGAVLERMLIMLGRHRTSESAVSAAARRLLESGRPTLVHVALMTAAHHPAVLGTADDLITELPRGSVLQLLAEMPRVRAADMSTSVVSLERIWRRGDCELPVLRVMRSLAARDAQSMADLFERLGVIEHFCTDGVAQLSDPSDLHALLFALAAERPTLVRFCVLELITHTPSSEPRIRLIEAVAEHWDVVGEDLFLAEILVIAQTRDATGSRGMRQALGSVIDIHRRQATTSAQRVEMARRTISEVTAELGELRFGAELAALGWNLRSSATDSAEMSDVVGVVFSVAAESGPPQIIGDILAPVLSDDGPACEAVSARLTETLRNGLPSPRNARGLSPAQHLATMARLTLTDRLVSPRRAALVIDAIPPRAEMWRDPHSLAMLLPFAAAGGSDAARQVVAEMFVDTDLDATDPILRMFVENAESAVLDDAVVANAVVRSCVVLGATGPLIGVLRTDGGRAAVVAEVARVRDLITALLTGDHDAQRRGAVLWENLQRAEILRPSLDDLGHAIAHVDAPAALAALLRMAPGAARAAETITEPMLALLRSHAGDLDAMSTDVSSQITGPARAAYRALLAERANPQDWPLVMSLALSSTSNSHAVAEPRQLLDVSTYIHRLVDRGDLSAATARFVEIAGEIPRVGYSRLQQRKASAIFHGIALAIVNRAEASDVQTVLESLGKYSSSLAEAIIRRVITVPGGRGMLDDVLARGLAGAVGPYAARRLAADPHARSVLSVPQLISAP